MAERICVISDMNAESTSAGGDGQEPAGPAGEALQAGPHRPVLFNLADAGPRHATNSPPTKPGPNAVAGGGLACRPVPTGRLSPPNVGLLRLANNRIGVRFEQVTEFLQRPGVTCDLLHVGRMAREGVREIHEAAADGPDQTDERAVVVGEIDCDVAVFADGDLGEAVARCVHRLAPDMGNQGVPPGVADNPIVLRFPKPDARRRLDPIAPVVAGSEERPDEPEP